MSRKEEQIRIRKRPAPSAKAAAEPSTVRKPRRRRKRRAGWRVMVLVLVLVLVLVFWKNWETLNPESVWEWMTIQLMGGARGSGYPYTIEGSNVLRMEPLGRQLAVLSDNALLMLNSTAGETVRRPHSFADPLMETAGNYVLLGELSGKRLRIETVHKTQCEITLSGKLIAAAVTEDGYCVVATEGTGSRLSEAVVYNAEGKEQYHWYSSDLLITDVALSEDGKQMAVCGMTTVAGSCQSRLLIFDVGNADAQPQKYENTNVLLCAVDYTDDDTVVAIGDEALWVVQTDEEQKQELSFGSQQLLQFGVGDQRIFTVCSRLGSTAGGTLTVRDEVGKVLYEYPFSEEFRDASIRGNVVSLMTDRHLYCFDRKGECTSWEVSSDGIMVASAFGGTAMLGLTEIRVYE